MKVQRVKIEHTDSGTIVSWVLLGDDHLFIEPVCDFIKYLENAERSPNTVRAYAYHLLSFFIFLRDVRLDWRDVKFINLSNFIGWLRHPPKALAVISFNETPKPARSETTVNAIVAAVIAFFQYQERLGTVPPLVVHSFRVRGAQNTSAYKPFLHHITKGKPQKRNDLKLKTPKKEPPVLTAEQVGSLRAAATRRRDRFLICLLYETGMRIGQALGLRHEDVRSNDNYILIVPRDDNENDARAKTDRVYKVHVSKELMRLYGDYLIEETGDIDSDYVFVNLWEKPLGRPFSYGAARDLFTRLGKKAGVRVTPHMFRHTHATELLRSSWDSSLVQKRLGHKSIQTTINTYAHISDEDLKTVYDDYLKRRDELKSESVQKASANRGSRSEN